MEIEVSVGTLKKLFKANPELDGLGVSSWRYSNKPVDEQITVALNNASQETLKLLRDAMKEADDPDYRQVSRLLNLVKEPENVRVKNLEEFAKVFTAYCKTKKIEWLYSDGEDKGIAYAVISCEYHPADRTFRGDNSHVKITLGYNVHLSYQQTAIIIYQADLHLKFLDILQRKGYITEDEDLNDQYDKFQSKFDQYGAMHAQQFLVRRKAYISNDGKTDDDDSDRGSSWWYWWTRHVVNFSEKGKASKAVLELPTSRDSTRLKHYSAVHSEQIMIPTHPMLRVFSLAKHAFAWVHVNNMRPYKYQEDIRSKLVLPKSHSRLIGALVSNLDALRMEDDADEKSRIIRAKASSSIILCIGAPGTGKTLTAEVYAEEIKRPLYEVHSGQLGATAVEIEENLARVLARAVRLNMPLLINEADIFIMKRGADMKQNAVCAVFLRLLEYHNGLVFLTTNRDDVDDAFRNRCIAEIRYEIPKAKERKAIWQIMLKEFNCELPEADVEDVVACMPKLVGRDIQNLIRLTHRVCIALGEEFSAVALKENAVFRGIAVEKNVK